MSQVIVYTAITGDKDVKRDDIKVFTEKDYGKFVSPVMNAKIFKVLPHKFLDYDISIWVDGNIYLNVAPEKLIDEWLGESDMAVLGHYRGKNLYWERDTLKKTFRNRTPWVPDEVEKQVAYYEEKGLMPDKKDIAMGGLIIRRNKPIVNQFNEAWWAEITRWSQRDQISFPIARARFPEMKVNIVRKVNIKDHPYLRYEDHAHYKT